MENSLDWFCLQAIGPVTVLALRPSSVYAICITEDSSVTVDYKAHQLGPQLKGRAWGLSPHPLAQKIYNIFVLASWATSVTDMI